MQNSLQTTTISSSNGGFNLFTVILLLLSMYAVQEYLQQKSFAGVSYPSTDTQISTSNTLRSETAPPVCIDIDVDDPQLDFEYTNDTENMPPDFNDKCPDWFKHSGYILIRALRGGRDVGYYFHNKTFNILLRIDWDTYGIGLHMVTDMTIKAKYLVASQDPVNPDSPGFGNSVSRNSTKYGKSNFEDTHIQADCQEKWKAMLRALGRNH